MSQDERSHEHCRVDALKLVGDYTTLRIIDFLSSSPMRFSELQRALADVNSVTLSNRLKRVAAAGLLKRSEATLNRQSVIYELSEMGNALLPVLHEMRKFAELYHSRVNES